MKRVLILSLAALLTFPLLAEEPKKTTKKTAAEPKVKATTDTAAPAAGSPLVNAARRSNRLGKKPTNVITNETLKGSKGHVTTTTVQRPVNVPAPEQGPEAKLAAERAAKAAKAKQIHEIGAEQKKAADTEKRAAAAEAAEDGGQYDAEDADPAQVEAAAEAAMAQKPPR